LAAQIKGLRPENSIYSASFRFIRPDGRVAWLEETAKAEFDANGRYLRLTGLTCDITERKRAEEQERLLVRELDHRVKNVLASVATVAQRTREGSGSIDEYVQVFDGRIQSMANAHALLSRSHWQGVGLAELVRSELAPSVRRDGASVEGPDVLLSAEATQPMAIVLHELVTNASKYGALSTPHGHVTVRWAWQSVGDTEKRLLLEWIETGGPAVVVPSQTGYGTHAIRNLVPYELCGVVEFAFDATGVRCKIELPSKPRIGTESVALFKASDLGPSPAATLSAEHSR
jgi:two-component sensor histidine kinase